MVIFQSWQHKLETSSSNTARLAEINWKRFLDSITQVIKFVSSINSYFVIWLVAEREGIKQLILKAQTYYANSLSHSHNICIYLVWLRMTLFRPSILSCTICFSYEERKNLHWVMNPVHPLSKSALANMPRPLGFPLMLVHNSPSLSDDNFNYEKYS